MRRSWQLDFLSCNSVYFLLLFSLLRTQDRRTPLDHIVRTIIRKGRRLRKQSSAGLSDIVEQLSSTVLGTEHGGPYRLTLNPSKVASGTPIIVDRYAHQLLLAH